MVTAQFESEKNSAQMLGDFPNVLPFITSSEDPFNFWIIYEYKEEMQQVSDQLC